MIGETTGLLFSCPGAWGSTAAPNPAPWNWSNIQYMVTSCDTVCITLQHEAHVSICTFKVFQLLAIQSWATSVRNPVSGPSCHHIIVHPHHCSFLWKFQLPSTQVMRTNGALMLFTVPSYIPLLCHQFAFPFKRISPPLSSTLLWRVILSNSIKWTVTRNPFEPDPCSGFLCQLH